MPTINPSGGSGGAQPALTTSLTTNPATFTAFHDFDFGGPAEGLLAVTITAIVADGETFGAAGSGHPGFIIEDGPTGNGPGWSADGVTYFLGDGFTSGTLMPLSAGSDPGFAVGQILAGTFRTPRYLRVPLTIFDDGGVVVYSGTHHPTVTARLDAVYLTP